MTDAGTGHAATRQDRIEIVEHDAGWSASFAAQAARLTPVLEPFLVRDLEHIGSTSVPGLPAKPIVDMLAVVRSADDVRAAVAPLADLSWVHAPEPGEAAARKWSFCYPDVAHRTHHLHVVEESSDDWPTWLAFRDHLRDHPDDAAEYARIKRSLASADDADRPRYRAGKAPFIADVLRRLRRPDEDAGA